MVNILIQLSKYIIIVLMAAYTFSCFSIFTRNYEDEEKRVLIRQDILLFLLQLIAFGTMYLATEDMRILPVCGSCSRAVRCYTFIQSDLSECIAPGRQ